LRLLKQNGRDSPPNPFNLLFMKKYYLIFFLFIGILGSTQAQDINRIQFQYDAAGNQVQRKICTNCFARIAKDTITTIKTPETLTEDDLIKDELYEQISYYPNPVREELYVKWVNENANFVSSIEVYNMTGQLVKKYNSLKETEMATVVFQDCPQGFYNLILIYSNDDRKTLKIVKK
jgi:hypothetical protein